VGWERGTTTAGEASRFDDSDEIAGDVGCVAVPCEMRTEVFEPGR
jgi:hypothetical protein